MLATPQHLYILSDEEIKEGEFYYCIEIGNIQKCNKFHFKGLKVIASTDSELNLPLIPIEFIKYYCEHDGVINEVDVEYRYNTHHEFYNNKQWEDKLKIAPDNTITIKPSKTNYTKKEVIELIAEFSLVTQRAYGDNNGSLDYQKEQVVNWLKSK